MLVHSVLDESDLAYGLRPSLRYCHFKWSESCSEQKKKGLKKQMDELLALQRKLQPFVDVHIPFCFLRGSFVIKMSCESVVQAHDLLMKKAGDRTQTLIFSKQILSVQDFVFTGLHPEKKIGYHSFRTT